MSEPSVTPESGATPPAPGTPEHDAAMAAKYRDAKAAAQANKEAPTDDNRQVFKPERPADVPEKFWDAEKGEVRVTELLKSLGHLESELTKTKQGKGADEPTLPKIETNDDDAAKAAAESAGLDWQVLTDKIAKDGKIDDSDYAALEEVGIPKELVDQHIELSKYKAEAEAKLALDHVGGQEKMNELMAWAGKNLSADEKAKYNSMLASKDWKVALDTLNTKFKESRPTAGEPSLVSGNAPANGSAAGYQSVAQMKADMADPRYQTDPAFRDQVAQKMQFASWRHDR